MAILDRVNWDMIAAVAQILGFAGVIWGLLQNRSALQTQIAMDFYRRFETISARMRHELRLAAYNDVTWSRLDDASRTAVLRAMIDYLNLCSEEYALFQEGRLPQDTWRVSKAEIVRNFRNSLWQDAWRYVSNEYSSHPGFRKFMEQVVAIGERGRLKVQSARQTSGAQ